MLPLILASASPRRLELLAQISILPVQIIPAEIDETPLKHELPAAYVKRVTLAKLDAVRAQKTHAVILAADTVVSMGRRILPKAENEATARQCLEKLSGRRHRVLTAVAIGYGEHTRVTMVETVVRFKRLSHAETDAYLASGEWQGKAGGYAIQGLAATFIPWISGSYSAVVGLPLAETAALLQAAQGDEANMPRPVFVCGKGLPD